MSYLEHRENLVQKEQRLQSEIHQMLASYTSQKRCQLLEKQYQLTNIRGKLKFMRPNNAVDMEYRQGKIQFFDMLIKGFLPDDYPMVFHGTPIYNAEKILLSGRIVSGKDLWTIRTSGDLSDQVSVSTKHNFKYTNIFYTGLGSYDQFLPAGCLFAIIPRDQQEWQLAQKTKHIHNVNFRDNPKRLYAIITTPENLKRVKIWVKRYGHTIPVYDYDGFVKNLSKNLAPCPTAGLNRGQRD